VVALVNSKGLKPFFAELFGKRIPVVTLSEQAVEDNEWSTLTGGSECKSH
jgi:hypothetical protein